MSQEELEKFTKVKSLNDFPKGVLLEISDIEDVQFPGEKEGEVISCGLARYSVTLPDKTRESGRVRLTETVLKNAWLVPPCLLFYQGLKMGKNNHNFYDVSALKCTTGKENLQKLADGFRSMTKSQMVACLTTQSLECFKPGTVFTFSDVKRKRLRRDKEECLTIKYETVVDGEELEGTLVVPGRLEEKLKAEGCGALVYRCLKKATNGFNYYDVSIMGSDTIIH
jgi:hypothetical protein